jgi:hypothetical protein
VQQQAANTGNDPADKDQQQQRPQPVELVGDVEDAEPPLGWGVYTTGEVLVDQRGVMCYCGTESKWTDAFCVLLFWSAPR